MPDEIGWPTPEEEAALDRAALEANKSGPPTAEELAEAARRCAAAKRYRLSRKRGKDETKTGH